jgi:predicted lysophospholipase L1 biosynthesis ABC-type transport system permease subunit
MQRLEPQKIKRRGWEVFPWVLTAAIFWTLLVIMVVKVDPEIMTDVLIPHFYLPFMVTFFLAVMTTVAVLRWSAIKGLIWGLVVTGYLALRILGIGHVVNLSLMVGLLVTLEYYWYVAKHPGSSLADKTL